MISGMRRGAHAIVKNAEWWRCGQVQPTLVQVPLLERQPHRLKLNLQGFGPLVVFVNYVDFRHAQMLLMLLPGRQYLAKIDVFYVYNLVFCPLFRHALTPRKYEPICRTTMIYTASAIVVTSGRNRSARATVQSAEFPII